MGMLLHLVQALVAVSIVYIGILVVGAALGILLVLYILRRWTEAAVGKGLNWIILAAVLLGALSGHASTKHVKPISDKEFYTEVRGIIKNDSEDIGVYQLQHYSPTDAEVTSFYVTRVKEDLSLLTGYNERFKHHQATREDVDTLLSKLLRDLEDEPPYILNVNPRPTL